MCRRVLILAAVLLSAGGCARWNAAPPKPSRLTPARPSPDSVALDVAFVRLPAADLDAYDKVWALADEQALPAELRRDLATNGLRVGVLGHELPAPLRERLDAGQGLVAEDKEDGAASDAELGGGRRHLQIRSGRWKKIFASKTYSTLPVLLNEDGHVSGHQLSQAQCVFTLKAYPQGDGGAKLELTPEIEHGEEKSQWAGSEGTLVLRTARPKLSLDRLRMEARLSPGQWLILSTTRETRGLGEYFFLGSPGAAAERTSVLIRLAQTQLDDLFVPEQTSAPLATPGE
jgi:hypothetical protein